MLVGRREKTRGGDEGVANPGAGEAEREAEALLLERFLGVKERTSSSLSLSDVSGLSFFATALIARTAGVELETPSPVDALVLRTLASFFSNDWTIQSAIMLIA